MNHLLRCDGARHKAISRYCPFYLLAYSGQSKKAFPGVTSDVKVVARMLTNSKLPLNHLCAF